MRTSHGSPLERGPACLFALSVVVSQGCYLTHSPAPSEPARRGDAMVNSEGGTDLDAADPDGGTPDGGAPDGGAPDAVSGGPDGESITLCERMCAALDAAGCVSRRDCMGGCLGRAEQAARVGCLSEWKAVTSCVIAMPCSDGICGETSGWPECIGARD